LKALLQLQEIIFFAKFNPDKYLIAHIFSINYNINVVITKFCKQTYFVDERLIPLNPCKKILEKGLVYTFQDYLLHFHNILMANEMLCIPVKVMGCTLLSLASLTTVPFALVETIIRATQYLFFLLFHYGFSMVSETQLDQACEAASLALGQVFGGLVDSIRFYTDKETMSESFSRIIYNSES
jgi:hypothetical protein